MIAVTLSVTPMMPMWIERAATLQGDPHRAIQVG